MRSSIRQVAELAQVSPMTVSRVLRGRKNLVNDATYERVQAAIQQLNYIPVRPAVQNRHVQTGVISFIPYHTNMTRFLLDNNTFQGTYHAARKHGYDLLVTTNNAEWANCQKGKLLLDRRSDGFIFFSPGMNEWTDVLEMLVEHNMPAVVCYRRDVPEGVAWVDPDNEHIMKLAVQHCYHAGHTKIAYLTGPYPYLAEKEVVLASDLPRHNYDDLQRQQWYVSMMEAHGLTDHIHILSGHADKEWTVQPSAITAILEGNITAVIAGNDYLALQLWDMAEAAGLSIPNDLSILGIDNDGKGELRGLTTIGFGYDEVGRLAVEAWVEMSQGKPAHKSSKIVPVHLVERTSVATPIQSVTIA